MQTTPRSAVTWMRGVLVALALVAPSLAAAQASFHTQSDRTEVLAQATPAPEIERWIDTGITGLERATLEEVITALPATDVYRENVVIVLRDGVFVNRTALRSLYGESGSTAETEEPIPVRSNIPQDLLDALPDVYEENLVVPSYWMHPANDGTGLKAVMWSYKPSENTGWSRRSIGSASADIVLPDRDDLRLYSMGTDAWGDTVFVDTPQVFFALEGNDPENTAYERTAEGEVVAYDRSRTEMGLVYRERGDSPGGFWSVFTEMRSPIDGAMRWTSPRNSRPDSPGNYAFGAELTVEMFVLEAPFPSVTSVGGDSPVDPVDARALMDAAPWAWTCVHVRLQEGAADPITFCQPVPDADPTGAHNRIKVEAVLAQSGGRAVGKWGYIGPYQDQVDPLALVLGTGSYARNIDATDVRLGSVVRGGDPSAMLEPENGARVPDGAFVSDVMTLWAWEDIEGIGDYPDGVRREDQDHFVQFHEGITKLRVDFCNSGWREDAPSFDERCRFNRLNLHGWRRLLDAWVIAIEQENVENNLAGFSLTSEELRKHYEACEFGAIAAAVDRETASVPAFRFSNVMLGAQRVEETPRYSFCAALDIDDGTIDGNQRTVITTEGSVPTDRNRDSKSR